MRNEYLFMGGIRSIFRHMPQVCKWLGVKSFDDALAADPHQQSSSLAGELRPPLLGLGADPKKHRKASTV